MRDYVELPQDWVEGFVTRVWGEVDVWWHHLRTARNNELKDMANLKGVNLPQDMFLESNLDYSLLRSKQQNKYIWVHNKKMWASTGKLPHHSITALNLHISDKDYLKQSILSLSSIVIKHQLLLIHTRSKAFNLILW